MWGAAATSMDQSQHGLGRQGAFVSGVVAACVSVLFAAYLWHVGHHLHAGLALGVGITWGGVGIVYRRSGVTWLLHGVTWADNLVLALMCHASPELTPWCYPVLLINVFLLPARPAAVANAGLIAAMGLALSGQVDALSLVRYLVSMASVGVSAHLFATRVERQRLQLEALATQDALSGAGNRRALDALLASVQQLQGRYGSPVSLVMFDIDHFKRVNDTHGHGVGDACIAALARAAQQRLRSTDRLFRYGGEEFVVVAPHTGCDSAARLAEGLRACASTAVIPGAPDLAVTISLGVAELGPREPWEHWLQRADQALYAAKREGRNRVEIAGPAPQASDASAA